MEYQEGSKLREDDIVLMTKVGLSDQVSIGEKEKILVDALGDDEGSTSFC